MYSPSQRIFKDLQTQAHMWHTSEDTHVHTPQGEPFQAKPHLSRPRSAKPNFGARCIKRTMVKPDMGTTSKTHPSCSWWPQVRSPAGLCQSPPDPMFGCKAHMGGVALVRNTVKQIVQMCFLTVDNILIGFCWPWTSSYSVFCRTGVLRSSLCSWISASNSERSHKLQGKVISFYRHSLQVFLLS